MKTIKIGFSKSSAIIAIFSRLIMAIQRTPYSHVYLSYIDADLNKESVYQASHTLVNTMSKATFLAQETIIEEFEFNISDDSFIKIKGFMYDNAGKSYGVISILGLLYCQIGLIFNQKLDNPFKDAGSTWVCDQLVAALLNSCENIPLNMDINNMTPKDLYGIVSKLPKELQ